jgi:hypothetical protein
MGQTILSTAANQDSPLFANGFWQDSLSQSVKGNLLRGSLRQPIRKVHVDSSQPNRHNDVCSLSANQNADKSMYFFATQSEKIVIHLPTNRLNHVESLSAN